jgi:hypothetical protein
MKKVKSVIILIAVLVIASGCTHNSQKVTVQKRVGDENVFEDYREVTQNKQVQIAKKIVGNIDSESNAVETKRLPNYQFQFPFKSGNDTKVISYSLWESPNGQNVEIANDNNRYVELTKQDSADLYKVLTGETLKK